MSTQIPAVVLGATGYVGGELLRLLAMHPTFELRAAVSSSNSGQPIAGTFAHLASVYPDKSFVGHDKWLDHIEAGDKLALFSAAPHGESAALIARALTAATNRKLDVHIVDSSADFRYATQAAFETVYGGAHGAPQLLDQFQSGLPEHVKNISKRHIGHPGCFATAVLLAAVPLIELGVAGVDLFVAGTTGSTGSGRTPQAGTHHPERNSNFYAYKPLTHRHTPEIEALAHAATGQQPRVHFVPHSGPFARGIHVTLQARLKESVSSESVMQRYRDRYANCAFVQIVAGEPRLKNVVTSNYAQIGVAVDGDAVVVMCSIDNLVKGAAGGAVQWMNRLWDLDERTGLTAPAPGWT